MLSGIVRNKHGQGTSPFIPFPLPAILESMDTILASWNSSRMQRLHKQLVPASKRAVKIAKKSFRRLARASQKTSMLNMGKPHGHITLPRYPSERERVLFAAHASRKEAGWIRG